MALSAHRPPVLGLPGVSTLRTITGASAETAIHPRYPPSSPVPGSHTRARSLDEERRSRLVIGDGYGVMTSLLLLASPESRVVTINLTKPLLVDLVFCRMVIPDLKIALVSDGAAMNRALARPDIRLVAVQADNVDALTEAPIRLAVNILSMQEMDLPVIHRYFHVLNNNKARKTVFYCCNQKGMNPIHVRDCHWSGKNKTLVDEPCAWMLLQYGRRPPFYSRNKRTWIPPYGTGWPSHSKVSGKRGRNRRTVKVRTRGDPFFSAAAGRPVVCHHFQPGRRAV